MCGIAGIFSASEEVNVAPQDISVIYQLLDHRGPDGRGFYKDEHALLVHTRLKILDLSDSGKQPMSINDVGMHVIHNGEVYNYIELKKKYKLTTVSRTDTEVLMQMFLKKGQSAFSELNGIYASAFLEKSKNRITLLRDRFGVKPLYYAFQKNVLYFSSEIKVLLYLLKSATQNDQIIHTYLKYGIYEHSEETFFENIFQVPPGHYLCLDDRGLTKTRYHSLLSNVDTYSNSLALDDVIKEYRRLASESVARQLRSDVKIALNVSGGLDCSILSHLVVNQHQMKDVKLHSWCYGEEHIDEVTFAKGLANFLSRDIEFHMLTPEIAMNIIKEAVASEEQPFPGISVVARYHAYSQMDADEIVILEGHGGDEIGAGYYYYLTAYLVDLFLEGKQNIDEVIAELVKQNNVSADEIFMMLRGGLRSLLGQFGVSADGTSIYKRYPFTKEYDSQFCDEVVACSYKHSSMLKNMQLRDIYHTKLPRVLKSVDRSSMAYGKEVRVPFLDHELAEFCVNLPGHFKISGGNQRDFMRKAFCKEIPEININSPKRAVPDPQLRWFKGPLKEFVQDILATLCAKQRPFLNNTNINCIADDFFQGDDVNNSFQIWQLVNLELWMNQFIDDGASSIINPVIKMQQRVCA